MRAAWTAARPVTRVTGVDRNTDDVAFGKAAAGAAYA
jgi:hypothetical protein